jgi:exosortase
MLASKRLLPALAAAGTFAFLYRDVVAKLVHDWTTDGNYSHGFVVVPLAAYFAWERRRAFVETPRRPSVAGLFVIAGSLLMLFAGTLGAELFLTRISMLATVAGILLFLFGRDHVRILWFPLAFLVLMIPIPAIVFNQVAFPLQLLASRFGESALSALHVPVLREGNVIVLANATLEVAEACSGIRSLVSLLMLGIVYGHFADPRPGSRVALAVATIPIAIIANGVRVAGTGVAAHWFGAAAAEGFFHTLSGWVLFVVAFTMLLVIQPVISRTVTFCSRLTLVLPEKAIERA